MKRCIFLLSLFFSVSANSQINYFQGTIEEAASRAKKENKIIMAVIESETCLQCNDVAKRGLNSEVLKRTVENEFIPVKINALPSIISKNNPTLLLSKNLWGIFFLDNQLNILYYKGSSSTASLFYLECFEKALSEKSSKDNMAELKKKYYSNLDGGFIHAKTLIDKILSLQLEPSQTIVDDLCQQAPADSASSLTFLQFILKTAPLINSNARTFVEKNKDNFNMAWYRMELRTRQSINGRITYKSLTKAIQDKDQSYAFRVAAFSAGTYNNNPEEAQQNNTKVILDYYKGVNDSLSFIRTAENYYNRYLMSIKVDSILKIDSMQKARLFNQPPPGNTGTGVPGVQRQTISFAPRTQYFANSLNSGAWTLYTYTKSSTVLNTALTWAKRANEFYETAESMDTYARLLYKTGNSQAAIEWETKAVNLFKQRGSSTDEYEKILAKMKNSEVKIDEY
jgi:hypothetical protein